MLRAFSSLLPSGSPTDEGTHTPVSQDKESKQSGRTLEPETPENKEQSALDLSRDTGSTIQSGIPVQNGSSGPASEANGIQATEQRRELHENAECVEAVSTSEMIDSSLEFETINSVAEQTNQTITLIAATTTTAEVEEQEITDVQEVEQSITVGETVALHEDASTLSSRTSASQQQYEVQSSIQGGAQSRTSFHQETRFPTVTKSYSSTSKAVETRGIMVPSNFTYSSARDEFLQMERLHREEKDRIVAFMTAQYEEYKRFCGEQSETLQTENERLVQEVSASASRIIQLEDQLNSMAVTTSHHEKVHSKITTITTTITSITTTMTTVTTRIEKWKQTVLRNKGQIMITSKELEQLSLELSKTSSQMSGLQQDYAELSKDFSAVRQELRVTLSLRDAKDRTIASLTAEVAEWKNADAGKAKQITATRRENETLRHDLSAATSRTTKLQQRYEAQSTELTSAHNELHRKTLLIEERDRKIASFIAEVARWKKSDAAKAKEIAASRRDHEKLQRDLSASTSQTAALQKRYDAQLKELGSVRSELQANKILVEEKERTITKLTAEVDEWKRADAAKAEQFAAEHRDKEKLQQDLASFSSQIADLQRHYDAQSKDIVSVRSELQIKTSLLEEKEHTITSLSTEVAQAKRTDIVKVSQITTARRDVEQLRGELSTASSRIAELQKRYEVQSKELNSVRDELHQIDILYHDGKNQGRGKPSDHAVSQHIARVLEKKNKEMEELRRDLAAATTRNTELQKSYEALSKDISTVRDELKVKTSQHEGTITTLTAQVEKWKRADTTKAERITTTLKQVEKLHVDLSTSTSQLTKLQSLYETQSREFFAMRKEFQIKTSSIEGKDRKIASLTAEVDEWKRADATKVEEIATTLKKMEKLQQDSTTFASELAEIRGRYETQSRDLIAVRNELQSRVTSIEDKDRTVAALTAQVEEWKRTDSLKEERIVTIRKQTEGLQRELTNSSSQFAELQQRYEMQSKQFASLQDEVSGYDRTISSLTSEVEEWKRSDASKAEELTTTRQDLESLRQDLTTSTSQITEFQQRYETRSTEIISEIEVWKRSDATKTEELTAARKDLEQLRRDLSTSSSQVIEYQQRSAAHSAELTSQIEQWKRSYATKSEELVSTREKLEQLQLDLSMSSSRITEFQERYEVRTKELASLREQLQAASLAREEHTTIIALNEQIEKWKLADAAKVEELARARSDLEQLQRKLSVSSTQIEQLQKHYAEQLHALRTSSSFVSEESREVYEKITTEVRDYASVIKLTSTVDEWLRADAKKAEDLALELQKRNKENEELRHHLVTLKEIYVRAPVLKQIFQSETVEVQQRHEEQSIEVKSTIVAGQLQLSSAQPFVSAADTHTDTAIIQALQKLNAEVQQSSTFMAECVLEDFKPRATKPTKEQISAAQRVSECIGQPLADCLGKKERRDVALYLPIALRTYLTRYLRWLISSWTVEKGSNDLINKTYERLQKSEGQTISGRWRSLTRAYISPGSMSDPDTLISSILAGLSDIVVAAGCASTPSAGKSKVSSKCGDKVSSIVSIAGQFSKMTGEVVSADFEVLSVRPLEKFEENTMEEDMDGVQKGNGTGGKKGSGRKVLCSTHLGMTKRMQQGSGKGDTLTVVKAKVVLLED